MKRLWLAAASIVLWLLLVLAWAASIRPGDPWRAGSARTFRGSNLTSIAGVADARAGGLRVTGLGQYSQAVHSWALARPLDASRWPILKYQVDGFPRTLELALIFRTREDPQDVRSITLPWAGHGFSAVDMSAVPQWRGHIIELGLSEYPLPGQTPPAHPFKPFVLDQLRLETSSWQGRLEALVTHWLDWNPWSMRSINSNGAATPFAWRGMPTAVTALAALGMLLLAWAFGLLRGRALRVMALILLCGWLLLDARWLGQMQRNHATSSLLFADRPWSARRITVADRPLQQRAERMREILARQQKDVHVLYWTPGQVDSVRLGYFLRPYNVAALSPGLPAGDIPDGTLLLIDDRDASWHWDSFNNRLSRSGYSLHGDLLWHENEMLLVGVREDAGR